MLNSVREFDLVELWSHRNGPGDYIYHVLPATDAINLSALKLGRLYVNIGATPDPVIITDRPMRAYVDYVVVYTIAQYFAGLGPL